MKTELNLIIDEYVYDTYIHISTYNHDDDDDVYLDRDYNVCGYKTILGQPKKHKYKSNKKKKIPNTGLIWITEQAKNNRKCINL